MHQAEKVLVTAVVTALPTPQLGMCAQGLNRSAGNDNAAMQSNDSSHDEMPGIKELATIDWTSVCDLVSDNASIGIIQVRTA
jgi:hypothetical protein